MPIDLEVDEDSDESESENEDDESGDEVEYITQVRSAWIAFRNNLAQTLFNAWRASSNSET